MKRWRLLEKKRNKKQYFISYRLNTNNYPGNNVISYSSCSCVYSCTKYDNIETIKELSKDIGINQSIDIISVSKL